MCWSSYIFLRQVITLLRFIWPLEQELKKQKVWMEKERELETVAHLKASLVTWAAQRMLTGLPSPQGSPECLQPQQKHSAKTEHTSCSDITSHCPVRWWPTAPRCVDMAQFLSISKANCLHFGMPTNPFEAGATGSIRAEAAIVSVHHILTTQCSVKTIPVHRRLSRQQLYWVTITRTKKNLIWSFGKHCHYKTGMQNRLLQPTQPCDYSELSTGEKNYEQQLSLEAQW